jgi:hypothetical protein
VMTCEQTVVSLIYQAAMICMSNIFSLSAEQLQGLIISTSIKGPNDVRIDMISLHYISSIVCILFAAVPLLGTLIKGIMQRSQATLPPSAITVFQIIMSAMALFFLCIHVIVQVCNHILYDQLRILRPDRCNLLPTSPSDRHDPKVDELPPVVSAYDFTPVVEFPSTEQDFIVKSSVLYAHASGQMTPEPDHQTLDQPITSLLSSYRHASEKQYSVTPVNQMNSSHPLSIYRESHNSSDVNSYAVTTQPTEQTSVDQTIFIKSIPGEYFVTPVHGVVPISDTEFDVCRKNVGMLVRWRRFYVLGHMMNILLVMVLLDMTGFTQSLQ